MWKGRLLLHVLIHYRKSPTRSALALGVWMRGRLKEEQGLHLQGAETRAHALHTALICLRIFRHIPNLSANYSVCQAAVWPGATLFIAQLGQKPGREAVGARAGEARLLVGSRVGSWHTHLYKGLLGCGTPGDSLVTTGHPSPASEPVSCLCHLGTSGLPQASVSPSCSLLHCSGVFNTAVPARYMVFSPAGAEPWAPGDILVLEMCDAQAGAQDMDRACLVTAVYHGFRFLLFCFLRTRSPYVAQAGTPASASRVALSLA